MWRSGYRLQCSAFLFIPLCFVRSINVDTVGGKNIIKYLYWFHSWFKLSDMLVIPATTSHSNAIDINTKNKMVLQ